MYPVLFNIGGWQVHSYGVMAALAFLLGSWIFTLNRRHARIDDDQSTAIILLSVAGGIVGARIFYVVQFYDQFRWKSWTEMFKIWQGGLVFLGGFLLAMLLMVIYCRSRRIRLLPVLDAAAPAVALAHTLGRIGCFLNGCCWSDVGTGSCFAVTYPADSLAGEALNGLAVHPVQLYEAAFNLAIFSLLFLLARKGKAGVAAGAYLALYGLWRFILEFWRAEPHYLWFSAAQWIGLAMIPAGVGLLCWSLRRPAEAETEPEAAAAPEK